MQIESTHPGNEERPVLLLEINEVPWRLVDWALAKGGFPALQQFFERAETFTTVNHDVGELSPWVTWPTFHRGVSNQHHGIKNLGQDVATFQGVPIWNEFRKRGKSIGLCGSLQSWPPQEPGEGGFYIPDTFAHDERCIPQWVTPLQRFNLSQVRRNGRVVNSKLRPQDFEVVPSLLRARLGHRFYFEVARQLAFERLKPHRTARRPTFQALLYWEVFKRLFNEKAPPAFSTFFTNHVAGVMHRFWDSVFPEDFPHLKTSADRPHLDTMLFALRVLDGILREALEMQSRNRALQLVFATSMGQAAVHRQHSGRELVLSNLPMLLGHLGFGAQSYTVLSAMVPQVAIAVEAAAVRKQVIAALKKYRFADRAPVFSVDVQGTSMSITLHTPSIEAMQAKHCHVLAGDSVAFASLGISVIETTAGTAYHIPQGIMAVVGEGVRPNPNRRTIAAERCRDHLLELSGLRSKQKPAPVAK